MSAIVMIADASESGLECWSETAGAIAALQEALPSARGTGIHILGTDVVVPATAWSQDLPVPARRGGSFVAPVLASFQGMGHDKPVLVIAGCGEVFDLGDWMQDVEDCVLIRTGSLSLQASGGTCFEIDGRQGLEPALARLAQPRPARRTHRPAGLSGTVNHEWDLDATGYPLVFVEPIGRFMQLFPITRSQHERLLAPRPQACGDRWYAAVLAASPRGWLREDAEELEPLLATALMPNEVGDLAAWYGRDYRTPGVEEWRTAYRWLAGQEASVPPGEVERAMDPTARRFWRAVQAAREPQTLLDLSLMNGGVLEWVQGANKEWQTLGKPRPAFHPTFLDPLRDPPQVPTSLTRRSRLFGIRFSRSA